MIAKNDFSAMIIFLNYYVWGVDLKYIIGSFIISFGCILVGLIVLISLNTKAPSHVLEYLGAAWVFLAVLCYPLARKIIR